MQGRSDTHGFTLIEISIVLVIIGLIVGGILVGQELISAAATRAQITQIERYNGAVNTFKTKYNGIPGDLNSADAATFGFNTVGCDGTTAGERDGNGILDSGENATELNGSVLSLGEPALFWTDLSAAGFVDGNFTVASCSSPATPSITGTVLYMPTAKINQSSYVYVFPYKSQNYFGISHVTSWFNSWEISSASFSVAQAYAIDKKIDDGIPITGSVLAYFQSGDTGGGGTCPTSQASPHFELVDKNAMKSMRRAGSVKLFKR